MEVSLNKESYALVEKLAYKFAYSTTSIKYDEYVNNGLDGLIRAINTYKDNSDTAFSTYATTCILNAMRTSKKKQERLDLVQDENVVIENLDTLMVETGDDNMVDVVKDTILKANKNNKRNADVFMLNIGLVDAPMDYKELSAKFNVTTERIRQICVNTRRTIKNDKEASGLLYSFVG